MLRDAALLLPGFRGISFLPHLWAPTAPVPPEATGGSGACPMSAAGGDGGVFLRHSCTPNCVLRWERVPEEADDAGYEPGERRRGRSGEGGARRGDGALVPVLRALTNLLAGEALTCGLVDVSLPRPLRMASLKRCGLASLLGPASSPTRAAGAGKRKRLGAESGARASVTVGCVGCGCLRCLLEAYTARETSAAVSSAAVSPSPTWSSDSGQPLQPLQWLKEVGEKCLDLGYDDVALTAFLKARALAPTDGQVLHGLAKVHVAAVGDALCVGP